MARHSELGDVLTIGVIIAVVLLCLILIGFGIWGIAEDGREKDAAWAALLKSGCKPTKVDFDVGSRRIVECQDSNGATYRCPGYRGTAWAGCSFAGGKAR